MVSCRKDSGKSGICKDFGRLTRQGVALCFVYSAGRKKMHRNIRRNGCRAADMTGAVK